MHYDHKTIEAKWQRRWEDDQPNVVTEDAARQKDAMYILDMFPYPSAQGLHVGHPEGYTATDIVSRYFRMRGKHVLHPMGWDAFGLPAENYAIKTKVHPNTSTQKNIETFRRQIKSLGFSYDWTREVDTSDPNYYRWTQWLFLFLYKHGLAYKKAAPVNWCSSCQTVLANEQVVAGACERCDTAVVQKNLEQWFFAITGFADRLLADLDLLDWPDRIKEMQRNWIGRSSGVTYRQKVKDFDIEFESYDSVPQTFMAQTFAVIAPEHPMVAKLVAGTELEKPVMAFVQKVKEKKAKNKFTVEKESEGIFTGRYLDNPFGTGDLPIWVSSFVIYEYGTGVVNCSVHDERDFAFAKKYGIPLRPVMFPADPKRAEAVRNLEVAYHHDPEGILQAPEGFKGRQWGEAREDIIRHIENKGFGRRTTQYKIRDWLVSRQRYWGAPIPIIYCADCGAVPVPEKDLPVVLPTDVDFKPTGESPLALSKTFHAVTCPTCGKPARRESDTMDTFVDSSWYFLRFADPTNDRVFADKATMEYWNPVDLYVGGAEHAVLHLLYARFITKALYDHGFISFVEPFLKLRNQGMILGENNEKMSKSRGNVVNPDEVVASHGADTLRIYEMFMGPFADAKPWSTSGMRGVRRFLDKVWGLYRVESRKSKVDETTSRLLHKTIKKVTEDIENFHFNTAVSAMMIFVNEAQGSGMDAATVATFLKLLAPFAPHLSEELWAQMGNARSIFAESWPTFDPALVKEERVSLVIQVNSRVRDRIEVEAGLSEDAAKEKALASTKVAQWIEGKKIERVIVVQDKLVNIVTS